ncbi:MAG: hypothetical protein GDA48_07155 [Hormoscilla sp. GM102CHS1]|nr:hypothetical protein [Hormoscilla sp. GM102CHS1]
MVLIRHAGEDGHGTGFFIPGPKGVCTVLTVNHVLPPQTNYRLYFQDKPISQDISMSWVILPMAFNWTTTFKRLVVGTCLGK